MSPRSWPQDSPASASPWEEQENSQWMWGGEQGQTEDRKSFFPLSEEVKRLVADKQEPPNASDVKRGARRVARGGRSR